MSESLDSSTAAQLALRMIDSGAAPPALADRASALALAWALKDFCYAAWSSEPARAVIAAAALAALSAAQRAGDMSTAAAPSLSTCEITALAEWTGGIGQITAGRMAEAASAFDRAAEAFRDLGQTLHAAQTQVPKIMALSMLGQYDQAAECAAQARQAFVALGDQLAAGKVSLNLGALHERRGAYAEAAAESRAAAVLFARAGSPEHSVMADINMANALTSLGDFEEALRIYARARMRAGSHGFPVLAALADEAVGLLQLARGNYREALAGLEGARRQYETLAMPQQLAIAEKQLADAYLELHLLPEALAGYEQVLARFQALDIPDEAAWTLAHQGRAQALLALPTQAAASFERAARLFADQGNAVGESAVVLARAELLLASGDAGQAQRLAQQAATGFLAAGLAEGHCRAEVVGAHALLQLGEIVGAQRLFNATLLRSRELQLLTVQVRSLTGQGLAAQAVGERAAAEAAFNAAVALFEEQRRVLPGDELRSAFLSDHLRPYQELLRMALQADEQAHTQADTQTREQNRSETHPAIHPKVHSAIHSAVQSASQPASHSASGAAEVLLQLDRFRARSLGERLANNASREGDPAAQHRRDRLNWLYRRVQRMEDEGESSAAVTEELRRTERELLEGARRMRLPQQTGGGAAPGEDEFDVQTLQQLLSSGDALVEYGVIDDELFACVVTNTGVTLHRQLASWPAVLEALRAARFQIETLRHGAAPVQRHLDSLTQRTQARMARLYALVWAPLADALVNCRRVLVVPHAQLGSLPFAALHDGERFLAQRLELAVAPSARLAVRGLQQHPRRPRGAFVLGESSRLPHAAAEAHFVAGLFPVSKVFVGADATISALRANAGSADVVHLACHGQFRSDNPMFSALQLADGALTVELTESLHLQAGTVVLSACETGLAELSAGDEMVGLVRAFLVAGAARVLASLWPVDDAVTAQFMASFYGALCGGESPAAALQLAQAEVMRQHAHPCYWAAFTLHGGW